uniref:Integrase zinc-binding domain-containing protein n=1 Tax=Romanomermis culicivorax TaxID=13658 RepID=A0A915IM94_ROMCU
MVAKSNLEDTQKEYVPGKENAFANFLSQKYEVDKTTDDEPSTSKLRTTNRHQGINKIIFLVKKHFWWPEIEQAIQNWVKSCDICQKTMKDCQPPPPLCPIQLRHHLILWHPIL